MQSIIIAFPKQEDAVHMKNLLIRNNFDVNAVCMTGAQVISKANGLDKGIVICGYRLSDLLYWELDNYLPRGFQLLLIATASRLKEELRSDIVSLSIPVKAPDLISTLELMFYQNHNKKKKDDKKPGPRKEKEKELILNAKLLLMERNHLCEEDAYRYIQKTSMDTGINMADMAQRILNII